MSKSNFYSIYFNKKNFLSYSEDSMYIKEDYLESQGFSVGGGIDFENKVVLELGAGAGRLSLSLHKLGLLQKAKKYIIAEPTDGIDVIKNNLQKETPQNVFFVKKSLENLHDSVPLNSVDYFIAYGVIPHVNMDLRQIFERIKTFQKTNGLLHIVSSYYGFTKNIAQKTRGKIVSRSVPARNFVSFSNALYQSLSFAVKGNRKFKKFYMNNFIYSPQKTFVEKYKQFQEFYSVNPYNINWSYGDYISCAKKCRYSLDEIYPYSLAVRFRLSGEDRIRLASVDDLRDKEIILLGNNDYFSDTVAEELKKNRLVIKCRMNREEIKSKIPNSCIILSGNYYEKPYFEEIAELEGLGYKFKKDLFFFQMVV